MAEYSSARGVEERSDWRGSNWRGEKVILTDDIGTLLGHTNEVSTGPMREFDSIYHAFWSDYIRHMADRRS